LDDVLVLNVSVVGRDNEVFEDFVLLTVIPRDKFWFEIVGLYVKDFLLMTPFKPVMVGERLFLFPVWLILLFSGLLTFAMIELILDYDVFGKLRVFFGRLWRKIRKRGDEVIVE